MTSTGPWPPAMLRLLSDISTAFDTAFAKRDEATLGDYLIGISVTSHDDHVATLYEEGWDFSTPKKEG